MSLAYRLLYRVGFTPWEQVAELPVADQIEALFAREEQGREPPYGEALDLGCGSGIWTVRLAERGSTSGSSTTSSPTSSDRRWAGR